MSGNFGPCGDVVTCNGILVGGKLVVNSNGEIPNATITNAQNITTKRMTVQKDAKICGNLYTSCIKEKIENCGIQLKNHTYVSGNVIATDLCLDGVVKIGPWQVVGAPQPWIGNAAVDINDVTTKLNQTLQLLRNHGLMISPP